MRSDVPILNRWRQDRAVTAGLGAPHRHIGPEVDDRWFDSYLTRRGVDVRCAICLDADESPVGVVSLTGIDPVHHHAEFHVLIGDASARGRGVGADATIDMLRHAFLDLNLHRVYLFVLSSNAAAVSLYTRVGFRREGTLREAAFKGGAFEDVLLMGMLQSEFTSA